MSEESSSYQQAGVDIAQAQRSLKSVLPDIQHSYNENVIQGVGSFGSMFRTDFGAMESPVLVSSVDGVGTKTKVAQMVGTFEGLGEDLVHHSVNDILCQGAKPLFFMDYFGTGKLQENVFTAIVSAMAEACRRLGFALIGGETAELPGVFAEDEFDVVGSIVGVVDEPKILPRSNIPHDSFLVGLASSGLHTNGFSLARRSLFELGAISVHSELGSTGATVGEALLRPHRCYFPAVYPLLEQNAPISAIAHITGGGIEDNLVRVLPPDTRAIVETSSWQVPEIFHLIQDSGSVETSEMYRVLNMGIGMILIVDRTDAGSVVDHLNDQGVPSAVIGELQSGATDVQLV